MFSALVESVIFSVEFLFPTLASNNSRKNITFTHNNVLLCKYDIETVPTEGRVEIYIFI
jgi:hypothetical protein